MITYNIFQFVFIVKERKKIMTQVVSLSPELLAYINNIDKQAMARRQQNVKPVLNNEEKINDILDECDVEKPKGKKSSKKENIHNLPEMNNDGDILMDGICINNDADKKSKKKDKKKKINKEAVNNLSKKGKSPKSTKHKKKSAKPEITEREYRIMLINLMAEREMLHKKLNKLNPGKRKDSMKIADINIIITEINDEIIRIQKVSGINIQKLDTGSKARKFFATVKNKIKGAFKAIGKFFRRNADVVLSVAALAAPIIGGLLSRPSASSAGSGG